MMNVLMDDGPPVITDVIDGASSSTSIEISGSARPGDLMHINDFAWNTASTAPSNVTPSGFTLIATRTSPPSTDVGGIRGSGWYKILTADDVGATLTGMNGTRLTVKVWAIYRMSRPVQSVSVHDEFFFPARSLDSAALANNISDSVTIPANVPGTLFSAVAAKSLNDTFTEGQFTFSSGPDGSVYYGGGARGSADTNRRRAFTFFPFGRTGGSGSVTVNVTGTGSGVTRYKWWAAATLIAT